MISRWTSRILVLLLAAGLTVGCSGKDAKTSGTEHDDDHAHGPGPHKGTIEDINGGKNHIEFTVDHKTKEVRVYILDGKAKKDFPIKADTMTLTIKKPAFTVELKSEPQEKDPAGMTSRFMGKDNRFGVEQEFAGEVTVVVEGKPWTAKFEEKPHK